ncbi:MAG: Radical domain protein [Bacteroidetes bacterium]|nr:Radical domain protein [Bacteroidota bacterium]
MIDVLFTHSYFLRFDPKEYKAMMPYPPLGTLYAAAYARERGYSVALFDSMLAEREQQLLGALAEHEPKVLVIYDDDFNYLTKMCLTRMRDAAFAMAEMGKASGCRIVIHGSDATDHLEKYFSHDADYVICGEGEHTLGELLDHLLRGQGTRETIHGLAFKTEMGIFRTPRREVVHALDSLPMPARDLVDDIQYRRAWETRHGFYSVNMVTTRGCPFHCNWCAKPLYGQVYNSRSPANVVDEMVQLRDTTHPDHIWFCDDIFGLKPGWVSAFRAEVVRRNALIPFKCLARVDLLLRDNVIADLRDAGCSTVWVGAESGSQKILDAMEKGTSVEQIRAASRSLHEAGIKVGFFLQFGYPGETEEDIALTFKMLRECKPDDIGISVSYPLPGTKFYDTVRAQLGEKQNWVDSEDLALMFRGTFSPDYYRVLHKVTHKRFRMWQGLDVLKAWILRPWKIDPRKARRILAAAYHRLTLPAAERRLHMLAGR